MAAHMRKRRRLLEPPLNEFRDKNETEEAAWKKREGARAPQDLAVHVMPGVSIEKEGARWQEEYNHEQRASRSLS